MTEFTYTVTDNEGLHARPAGLLVKKAAQYGCDIRLVRGERAVDLKRIFAVMSLCVKQGETITIQADGDGEEQAMAELKAIMEEHL